MSRILSLDTIKGCTMILVVWAHCIQHIGGYEFEDNLFSLICSFHMPMFMITSGYLFSSKINTSFAKTAKKQFTRLILPSKNSLPIYILHLGILQIFDLNLSLNPSYVYDMAFLLLAIAFTMLLNIVVTFMRKSKYVSLIFLGESKT